MRLPYSRLYLRMAVYIGTALLVFILFGAGILAVIASYELQDYVTTRQSALGKQAAEVLARDGRKALEVWLREDSEVHGDALIFILDQEGEDILKRQLPAEYANFVTNSIITPPDDPASNYRPLRLTPQLIGPDNEAYFFLVLPEGISLWGNASTLLALGAVALLIIASVAWLIASRFSKPIGELQAAVRQLASGHVEARVPSALANRRDELGSLAADFNLMADKLQTLMDSHEQLMHEMSHELRSPLARLQASLALTAHRQRLETDETRQIETEIRRMDRMIGDMLRFSKLDAQAGIAQKLVRIDKLLRELVSVEDVEARARGCVIHIETDRNLEIIGDPDMLRSGFENILRNAIRYAPADSRVDITGHMRQGAIHVTICDRGPGVPPKHLERIFEPFFRVKNESGDTSGSGLGLAIARRAFKAHEGTVIAATRNGGGLCFEITLPAAQLT